MSTITHLSSASSETRNIIETHRDDVNEEALETSTSLGER
jgi:hypothetical protein